MSLEEQIERLNKNLEAKSEVDAKLLEAVQKLSSVMGEPAVTINTEATPPAPEKTEPSYETPPKIEGSVPEQPEGSEMPLLDDEPEDNVPEAVATPFTDAFVSGGYSGLVQILRPFIEPGNSRQPEVMKVIQQFNADKGVGKPSDASAEGQQEFAGRMDTLFIENNWSI